MYVETAAWVENRVNPDQIPRSAADLGLYCSLGSVSPGTKGK